MTSSNRKGGVSFGWRDVKTIFLHPILHLGAKLKGGCETKGGCKAATKPTLCTEKITICFEKKCRRESQLEMEPERGAKVAGSIIYSYLPWKFLRTARSFYGSLWYLQVIYRTSHLPYVLTSHPTLKLTKQKMSKIIQVNVPIFFYFDEIPKMTKLGPKNRFWDLKI